MHRLYCRHRRILSDGEDAAECDIETLDQIGKDLKESMRLHLACDMTAVDKGRFVLILYTGDPVRAKALLAAAGSRPRPQAQRPRPCCIGRCSG